MPKTTDRKSLCSIVPVLLIQRDSGQWQLVTYSHKSYAVLFQDDDLLREFIVWRKFDVAKVTNAPLTPTQIYSLLSSLRRYRKKRQVGLLYVKKVNGKTRYEDITNLI